MQKANLVELICFFIVMFGCGSSAFSQPKALRYHENINLAELAICDSDFVKANEYYSKAFEINPDKPFSRDICNAFFSAMDSKNYLMAETYLSRLLSRGLGARFIKVKIISFYNGEQLKRIQQILATYPNDTIRTNFLVSAIKKMTKQDQDVRLYFSTLNDGAYMVDSTYKVDYLNALELLKLFNDKGVPNENILGNNYLYDFSPSSAPAYYILILHHNGGAWGGRPSHLLDTLLYRAVFTLDFNPHSFAHLVHLNALSSSFKYHTTVLHLPFVISGFYYDRKIYPQYWNNESEQKMNEERAKIGLEPLGDFRKKIMAHNIGIAGNSVLSKYLLLTEIAVEDGASEAALNKWLSVNGENALKKKSIFTYKHSIPKAEKFDMGVLGDRYVLGKTSFDSLISWYQKINQEYYQGQIFYKDWKNRQPPLPWNYHAEVLSNPNEDISSDYGRSNKAKIPFGYKMLIEHSNNFWFGTFRNIELIFKDNILISYSAFVDTSFYKTIIRYMGPPGNINDKCDTVDWPEDNRYNIILHSKKYIWEKDNDKIEVCVSDRIDDKGKKQTSALFSMTDGNNYRIYLNDVETENKKLKEKYNKR